MKEAAACKSSRNGLCNRADNGRELKVSDMRWNTCGRK